jgi:hypothetical protein
MTDLQLPFSPDDLAWFEDSPDAGCPECICSYCGNQIGEDEIPLRFYRERPNEPTKEARLCENCSRVHLGAQF